MNYFKLVHYKLKYLIFFLLISILGRKNNYSIYNISILLRSNLNKRSEFFRLIFIYLLYITSLTIAIIDKILSLIVILIIIVTSIVVTLNLITKEVIITRGVIILFFTRAPLKAFFLISLSLYSISYSVIL